MMSAGSNCIDCDVRIPIQGAQTLLPYLPEPWYGQVKQFGLPLPLTYGTPANQQVRERIANIASLKQLQQHYTDPCAVARVILHCPVTHLSQYLNIEYALALATACNDYVCEQWLDEQHDDGQSKQPLHVQAAMTVATQDPLAAAREIARVGSRPGIAHIQLSSATEPLLGQHVFDPLYEAAEHYGLPLYIVPGAEGSGIAGAPSPYGYFSDYFQFYSYAPHSVAAQLISLVGERVFDRFPRLKFVFGGVGFSWLPQLMWRLDDNYRALQAEMPAFSRKPSDVIREHCYVTTHPLDSAERTGDVLELVRMGNMEQMLLFASGYPAWDFNAPQQLLAAWPEILRSQVCTENARKLYKPRDS